MKSDTAQYKAASKYFGDVAAAYDDRRTNRARWEREQQIVAEYVQGLPIGSQIADVPFGTGRFAPFYIERGLQVFGADISEDMIAIAKQKLGDAKGFRIEIAAAESLPLPDRSVDFLISHRFVKWLPDFAGLKRVMAEFARVTRREMFLQVKLKRSQGFFATIRRALRKLINNGKASSRQFTELEMDEVIRENGFRIKNIAHHNEISGGVAYYTVERIGN